MAMAYVYLAAAIIFEVLGTITMKYSEGFTKVIPIVLTLVCHGICFVALAAALKSLPISMVYSIWAGAGTAAMAFIGLALFNEALSLQKVMATVLIVAGVVMLNFTQNEAPPERLAKDESVKALQIDPPAAESSSHVAQRNSG